MLLFIYIGVISENKLNSSIMKKVVLTLALAVTGLINAQTHAELGISIDTTYEYGSFYYPVIVRDEKYADPYTWVYVDKYKKDYNGLMIYGWQDDINDYCDSIIEGMGNNPNWKVSEVDGAKTIKEWEVITEDGYHCLIFLINYDGIGKLYIDELSYEEHINLIESFKKSYIIHYGKEQVNKWLGKN